MTETKKLGIFEAAAGACALLSFIFCFLPAYFEEGRANQSIFHMAGVSPVLWIGIIALILAFLLSFGLAALLFLGKANDKITTILSISAGILALAGGILLALSLFVCGYDKSNSQLGFTQGAWGIKIGTILVPVFALLTFFLSYPSALISPHHLDLQDRASKKEA